MSVGGEGSGASQRMHPALGWALAASVVASTWALWWPHDPSTGASTTSSTSATPALVATAPPGATASNTAATRRTTEPEAPPMLSPASRDPFNSTPASPPATEAKPEPEPVRNEPAPQPPAPTAPPMTHRILGRFQSPDGEWLVFLQDGAQAVLAAPGAVLSSGYVVETVTPREIRLRHPLAEQPVSLPLSAEHVAPEDNAP